MTTQAAAAREGLALIDVALAGNPNTGKSTVFNALTGLRQHTGNWPGKTVARAEGFFGHDDARYRLVDLPGTYSLRATSVDEEIARDHILFDAPACVVIVVDATALERNLHFALQVLQITDRAVICLNLMDEARKKAISVDTDALSTSLGVPVIPTAALTGEGLDDLRDAIHRVATGAEDTAPARMDMGEAYERAVDTLEPVVREHSPHGLSPRWAAMRLLDGDDRVREAVETGEFAPDAFDPDRARALLAKADALRETLDEAAHDEVVHRIYAQAERIANETSKVVGAGRLKFTDALDRALTSPVLGLPVMLIGLAAIFWVTVVGANYPSRALATALFWVEAWGAETFRDLGAPFWLTGLLWHGVYRALAWVVAVMLPPMAIFFPIFTILEDFGLLPRVAFNMDRALRKVGAHGKMALTMCMGFGCNAAGVTACRVIDSPRERLIAILTNNFVPCNGRFPTLIMLAMLFAAASMPPVLASFVAAGAVVAVTIVGIAVTMGVSWALSRTLLKGEPSFFTLELPAYRRPQILRTLYTSLIDRTLFVLYRAVMMAMPAGALIWVAGAIHVGDMSLAMWVAGFLEPMGRLMGLDGVILFAYIAAIPANEIVVPTIVMIYMGSDMMSEMAGLDDLRALLIDGQGWTLLTASCLMLFSLLHNPCSTTIWTTWKETRSAKWTALGAVIPLGIGVVVTVAVAALARLL
ncbi:ferrous iron transport protein B [Candidatus Poribacteria bacterium]|nr:ferrous iron transport protein B [Candidatus Poribacteria bacterium]